MEKNEKLGGSVELERQEEVMRKREEENEVKKGATAHGLWSLQVSSSVDYFFAVNARH